MYKLNLLTDAEVTFLLTSGGHNAGIVSEPGHPHRHYRVATKTAHDHYVRPRRVAPDDAVKDGSWWPEWVAWLDTRSGAAARRRRWASAGGDVPLCDAPGTYVLER